MREVIGQTGLKCLPCSGLETQQGIWECGLPAALRTTRASECLAPQRVEGEVRERQSTSLVDRDPNPER